MTDLFGTVINRYYFIAPGWQFCVLVETTGSEFDAIAATADVLPPDAAPYENPECKTLAGKRVVSIEQYKVMEVEL